MFYLPPSSVITATVVAGPIPAGLKTWSDTKYCEKAFNPRIVNSYKIKKYRLDILLQYVPFYFNKHRE